VPPFSGPAPRGPLVELVIPANAIQANATTRQITIKGIEAKLVSGTATTFNNTLNQGGEKAPPASSEFAAGELFGTFSMTLQAQ
jgi:hypothetical protein